MKTAAVQHFHTGINPNRSSQNYQIASLSITLFFTHLMKKLTYISPFLLLLVPVFLMMVLSLASQSKTSRNEDAAVRTNTHTSSIVEVSSTFFK